MISLCRIHTHSYIQHAYQYTYTAQHIIYTLCVYVYYNIEFKEDWPVKICIFLSSNPFLPYQILKSNFHIFSSDRPILPFQQKFKLFKDLLPFFLFFAFFIDGICFLLLLHVTYIQRALQGCPFSQPRLCTLTF